MLKKTSVLVSGLSAGLFVSAVHAAVLYDSGGFESAAGFTTTGGLNPDPNPANQTPGSASIFGQPSYTGANSWVYATTNGGSNPSQANIVNTTAYSGSQSVQFIRSSSDLDTYYYPQLTGDDTIAATNRFVDVSWAMKVSAGATKDPFMGIYAFNGSDSLGYAGVDATTGNVEISDGNAAVVATSTNIALGTWNTFDLRFDYAHSVDSLYVDGSFVASEFFASGTGESGITDADIFSGATSSDGTGTGTAFYDSYLITSSVPEPASMSILLLSGSFGLLGRNRSKRRFS